MLVSGLPHGRHVERRELCRGVMWFYSLAVEVKSFSCMFLPFVCAWQFHIDSKISNRFDLLPFCFMCREALVLAIQSHVKSLNWGHRVQLHDK